MLFEKIARTDSIFLLSSLLSPCVKDRQRPVCCLWRILRHVAPTYLFHLRRRAWIRKPTSRIVILSLLCQRLLCQRLHPVPSSSRHTRPTRCKKARPGRKDCRTLLHVAMSGYKSVNDRFLRRYGISLEASRIFNARSGYGFTREKIRLASRLIRNIPSVTPSGCALGYIPYVSPHKPVEPTALANVLQQWERVALWI